MPTHLLTQDGYMPRDYLRYDYRRWVPCGSLPMSPKLSIWPYANMSVWLRVSSQYGDMVVGS